MTGLRARLTVFSIAVLFAGAAHADLGKLPSAIDFKLAPSDIANISLKNFCRVSAQTETYNGIASTRHTEYVTITCDGQSIAIGGPVNQPGYGRRLDQILSQVMGQLLVLDFKVVTCETDSRRFAATCTVAKKVAP